MILKNKKHKRIVDISNDHMQITTKDSRYYQRNGKYYPSITFVLQMYPKGPHYIEWIKKHGFNSDYIAQKAAKEGTIVHGLCEDYLNGEEISYLNHDLTPRYDHDIWQMFLRFVDFWETYKPTLLETEVHLFSDKLRVAGTCDIVCEINGEVWIIDLKTSNQMQATYEIQTSIYKECYEECYGVKVAKTGILWLKSSSRGADKTGRKIQGKNWILVEPEKKHERNVEIFKVLQELFELEHPKSKPFEFTFPTKIKRKE